MRRALERPSVQPRSLDRAALDRAALALALAFCVVGCGVEVGGHAGASTLERPLRFAAGGHVAASIGAVRGTGALAGVEIEGAARSEIGSTWTVGAFAGFRRAPDARPGAPGWELRVDGGARVEDAVLGRDAQLFVGTTFAVPIWVGLAHEGTDLNQSYWLVMRGIELVPFARVRLRIRARDAAGQPTTALELAAGLALRVRFVTDLL